MREALHSPISRLSPASLQSDTENKDVVPKNLDSEAKFRGIHAEKLRCPQDLQKRLFALHCISIDVTGFSCVSFIAKAERYVDHRSSMMSWPLVK